MADEKKHTPESVAAKVARALLKAQPAKKKPRKRGEKSAREDSS